MNLRVHFDDCALGLALPKAVYHFLFWSGYPAVIVFFVISGFLITAMSEERWGSFRALDVKSFYRIRFARIAPCLLLFVVVQAALQAGHVPGFFDETPAASLPRTVLAALTFHVNWLEAKFGYLPGAWDVLWSLGIEELFYLGFPLAVRALSPLPVLVTALGALVGIGPFARVALSTNPIWMDHSYLSCMGEIALGCLAAIVIRRRPLRGSTAVIVMSIGLGLMSLPLFFRRTALRLGLYATGLDVTVLALGAACVLMSLVALPRLEEHRAFALLRPLTWFGRNSYEVYLSHLFVVVPLVLLFKRTGFRAAWIPALYAVAIVASGVVGSVLADTFSRPLTARLRGGRGAVEVIAAETRS